MRTGVGAGVAEDAGAAGVQRVHGRQEQLAQRGGWALVAAAVSGAAVAVFMSVVPQAVSDDRFSHPLSADGFTALQVALGLHHLLLVYGLWAVWRAGFAGTSRLATVGGALAVVSMLLLALQEWVAISGRNSPYPSDRTDLIEGLYGGISMFIGMALIVLGVAALRARVWAGWQRWVLLGLGVYVFVPLTPATFAPFLVARMAIGLWMLLFGLLGWALLRPELDRHTQAG